MKLLGGNKNLYQNLYLNHKKLHNLKMRNKDYTNYDINMQKSKKILYTNNNNNKIVKNNLPNNIDYSSINREDIHYMGSPSLKDKILSPGDDDICIPKKRKKKQENFLDDDICFYNIKNIQYKNNNKKILILDLDETLVHSSFQPLGKDKNNNIIEPDIFLKIFFDKKYYNLYVLTRPYINQFLNDMSKLFIIFIFTASIQEYANPLLNEIDKNNIISQRFYRDSCTLTKDGKYVKNLNMLNQNLKDVILLDNNPISYSFNKNNGIPIKSWHNDKNDKELIKIGNFLNFLSSVDDVRYYIPRVVENDEISYYKVNIMISQQINKNSKEDITYSKIDKKTRNNFSSYNNSVDNKTPHKKINFNNDDYIYLNLYTKTESNITNNKSAINYREPKSKNRIPINKNKFLSFYNNKHINLNNNIKININSINFNFDKKKQKLKTTMTEINIKENKDINNSFHKIPINKIIQNKNFFHKHRLSANNLVFNNKLNHTNTTDNKDMTKNYSNINNSNINHKNNNTDYYNCHSYNKNKKIHSIYGYNLKKKNTNGKNIKNILEDEDNYYNCNLYKEKNNNLNLNINIIDNNKEQINEIKVNKNISNNSYYNKTTKTSNTKNKKLKTNDYENYYGNINNINRNEKFKECKTFCNNKESEIIVNNNKNVENGKNKYSIFSLFKQKFLSAKEPVKIKILKKENKPEIMNNKNTKLINKINRTNSKDNICKNLNYYRKRKNGMVKERSCTEFINNFNFNNNYINDNENENENINYNSNINFHFSNKTFNNKNVKKINYNKISNDIRTFNGLKGLKKELVD